MLRELKIENLAIIKELFLELGKGLIVLTGETGAGKSIILNGINLLIGEKANVDMIRDGENQLNAEGVFFVDDDQKKSLEELGIEIEENEAIIRRTLDITGKGKAFVNNTRVTLAGLKEVMTNLVDIVGQHSHQMLLSKSNHIKLLDSFLPERGKELKIKVDKKYMEYISLTTKIEEMSRIQKESAEKREFYEFQLKEIDAVAPISGEDNDLEEEYKKLFNAGMIKEKLSDSKMILSEDEDNILHKLSVVVKNLQSIGKYGNEYQELADRIERSYYEMEDCSDILSTSDQDIDMDDARLQEVAGRLEDLKKLKLKYGSTIEEILNVREDISKKIKIVDESGIKIQKLTDERKQVEKECSEAAAELSKIRKDKAQEIETLLGSELSQLKMENAKFSIRINKKEYMSHDGYDDIEFFISTNLGQEERPLWKIVSGGEVSRIMLALKVVFSRVDNIPTLIFDEIDTGVGGETVRKIAAKLKDIGSHAQIIAITHSPAIAAAADEQFFIKKEIRDGKTETTVNKLTYEERIQEIARMLAGDNVTDSVYQHAKELLEENHIMADEEIKSNKSEFKSTLF